VGDPVGSFICFPSVLIPQGATIDSAFLRFTAYSIYSTHICNLKCYFNDIDNAIPPTTPMTAIKLKVTNAIEWNDIPDWVGDTQYDTPELKTILQTVINRSGWVSGNSLQVIMDNGSDLGAIRFAYSHDEGVTIKAPTLFVTFTAPLTSF
jgi:type IV pilus assembly protein PilY1